MIGRRNVIYLRLTNLIVTNQNEKDFILQKMALVVFDGHRSTRRIPSGVKKNAVQDFSDIGICDMHGSSSRVKATRATVGMPTALS